MAPALNSVQVLMVKDPHEKEQDKPFWKLLAHNGQPHEVMRARARVHPC
jgi:hypothetical protein